MRNRHITLSGVLVGMVAAVAMAALLFAALRPSAAAPPASSLAVPAAAGVAQAAPTTAPAPPSAAASATDDQHYANLLVQNLAGRLGTDSARLNSAFTAAANETIDQAVRDGKLDQALAVKAKAQTSQGLAALVAAGFPASDRATKELQNQGAADAAIQTLQPTLARLFGMTEKQLADTLKGGQTLQSLEQAHNVTHQQVTDAVLAAIRAALNTGVPKGQWSQADADKTYEALSAEIDNVLFKFLGAGVRADKPVAASTRPEQAAFESALQAIAGLFGMQSEPWLAALSSGQTTLLQLEQAHNVTEQQVADKALAAVRNTLAAGVQGGKWSQADADAVAKDFADHVYDYLAKFRNAFAMPALIEAAQQGVAPLFGMTADQFTGALKTGQTLQSLEQAHHVSAQQVKDAALAAARTRLATGVQNKEWTQAQADDTALVLQETLDQLVTSNLGADVKTGK